MAADVMAMRAWNLIGFVGLQMEVAEPLSASSDALVEGLRVSEVFGCGSMDT